MKRYSSQLVRLDDEMLKESKELLEAMGIMVVQAPEEGESECAYLCRTKKEIYASVSQDYDSLLFGAPILIRNLALSRKKKNFSGDYVEVFPEIIELENVLKNLEINQEQLICLGILVGTDYNPRGVPGIGQKRALEIVKKLETKKEIFESVKDKMSVLSENDKFDYEEIFELFKNFKTKDIELNFPRLNPDKIKKFLVNEHDFSEERVEKQIERLEEIEKEKQQKSLNKWF
jgi:flap endonuclease-1